MTVVSARSFSPFLSPLWSPQFSFHPYDPHMTLRPPLSFILFTPQPPLSLPIPPFSFVFVGAICLTAAEPNSRFRTIHHVPTRYVHSMCTCFVFVAWHNANYISSIPQYITVYHSIPQYTTVHAQYTTVYLSISQYTSVYHSILQYTSVYHSISQYTTVYHSIPQYTTVHLNII